MVDRINKPTYLPTPDEIERHCQEIRSRWSERKRERRLSFAVDVVSRSTDKETASLIRAIGRAAKARGILDS